MTIRTLPASTSQRLLWLLDHYRGQAGAANCPVLCRIRGPLSHEALFRALDELMLRHEALRTTFSGRGQRLTQSIHASRPFLRFSDDLSRLDEPRESLEQAIRTEMQARIDTTESPVRAHLWRVGGEEHVLCINMHHLVTDGWSCGLVHRDLCSLLEQATGRPVELPPVVWQYADFAEWHGRLLESEQGRTHQSYWRRKLLGAELPNLPNDAASAGGGEHDPASGIETLDIDSRTVSLLSAFARQHRTTPFSAMLAVYYALLRERTGQDDLTIASVMANRLRPEVQQTVGVMANMVLLRGRFPRASGFEDIVRVAHRSVLEAFVHQAFPYQLLPPDTIQTAGRAAHEIVFQMISTPMHATKVGDLAFETFVPEDTGHRFDLELDLYPHDEGFRAVVLYNRRRFDSSWARSFLTDYARLARSLVEARGELAAP